MAKHISIIVAALIIGGSVLAGAFLICGGILLSSGNQAVVKQGAGARGSPGKPGPEKDVSVPGKDFNPAGGNDTPVPGLDFNPAGGKRAPILARAKGPTG
jgi:hypothetical protein